MVQGIFLQMTNSVNKQNASDISLFICPKTLHP